MPKLPKFRALDHENNFVYGYYLYQSKGNWSQHRIYNDETKITHDVNSDTLCQSTGLFDKNGMEIYEGDILYFPNDKKTCKVVYHNGAFGVDYYYDSHPTHLFHWYDFVNTSHEKIIPEIIGNIHQNPELLNN